MKKVGGKLRIFVTAILMLGWGLLVSCDGFFESNDFKEQLEKDIAYAQAKECKLIVKSDSVYGSFLSDGEKKCKVGYTTDLQFTVNQSDYIFKNLEAVSTNDNSVSRNDFVEFTITGSDEKTGTYKITVKLLKEASDILIRPSCILLPKITEITPVSSNNGIEQNTPIEITFNKSVDSSTFTDFSSIIRIENDTSDLAEFFDTPYFSSDGTKLVIPANPEKMILPPDGSQNLLEIKLTYDFSMASDIDGLPLSLNGTHSYRINKTFLEQKKVTLTVNSEAEYGSFLSAGEKECTVGYTIDLQFTLNKENYIFKGLEAVSTSTNTILTSEDVLFTLVEADEESGVYKVNVRVLKEITDLLIRPKWELIQNASITISGSKGKMSPASGTLVQSFINKSYSISFEPDTDYEFIRWQIYDKSKNSENEIENGTYITLADAENESTTYTLTALPENDSVQLAIRAVIAERPQILSYSPIFTDEGTRKDTAIQVVFDYDMDESSIYYTKEEIISLNESGIAYTAFLPEVTEDEISETGTLKKHYGYKTNGEVFYKNIFITDNETGANRNSCFNAPVFDSKRILTISANKTKLLPSYSIPLVTLDKNFCYKVDGKKVSMAGSKKWIYQVNKETDGEGPVIQEGSEPEIYLCPEIIEKTSDEIELRGKKLTAGACSETPWAENIFNNDKKLGLDITVKDNGIGPTNMFTMNLQKMLDSNYEPADKTYEKTLYYQNIKSKIATYQNIVDLSDLNLEHGVYAVSFVFKDKSNNDKKYPESGKYYFVVDKVKPAVSKYKAEDADVDINASLSWENAADIKQSKIEYKKQSDSEYTLAQTLTIENSYTVTGLLHGTDYDIRITTEDYNGNISTQNTTYTTKPGPVRNIRRTEHDSRNITIEWDPPENGDFDGYELTYYVNEWNNTTNGFNKTVTLENNVTSYVCSFASLSTPQYQFNVSITTNRGTKTNAAPQSFAVGTDFTLVVHFVKDTKVQIGVSADFDHWDYKVYKWNSSTGGTDYVPQESDYYADMTENIFKDSNSYYSIITLGSKPVIVRQVVYTKRNYRVKAINKKNPEIVCWSNTYRAPDVDPDAK